RVAVDLARRCQQEASPLELRQPEGVVRAVRADPERMERHSQVVDRAGKGGKVEDEIDGLVDGDVLRDVVVHEDELVLADVLHVLKGACYEAVDADDAVALGEDVVAEVGAEEPGSTGDDGRGHCRDMLAAARTRILSPGALCELLTLALRLATGRSRRTSPDARPPAPAARSTKRAGRLT